MSKNRSLTRELHIAEGRTVDDFPVIGTHNIKKRVHNSVGSPYTERRVAVMKANMKYTFAAVLVIVLLATSAVATSSVIKQWNSSAAEEPEFLKLPTVETTAEYVDFYPVLIERFGNGYSFESGSVVSNELINEDNQPVEQFNSLEFSYVNDGDRVYFWQGKSGAELTINGKLTATMEGVDIYYHFQTYKVVPEKYEMTEEDKAKEESGELVFSWGNENIDLNEVQSVSWMQDGVYFLLQQIDGGLTEDDLVTMAMEIIGEYMTN